MSTSTSKKRSIALLDYDTVRHDVDGLLDDFFSQKIAAAHRLNADYEDLWHSLSDTVRGGGKRLRPYLVMVGHAAAEGDEQYDTVLQVAVAQELLHQCFLIHDDIIDNDVVRHGKPNVTGQMAQKYAVRDARLARELASSAALLAGDLLLSESYQIVSACELSAATKQRVMLRMGDAVWSVGCGELLDSEAVLNDIAATDARLIAELKTASYSFIAPLQCGAELANASDSLLGALGRIGELLGVAYQLEDDILGLFGDPRQVGKSLTSDIQEGKHTLLIQYALAAADEKQQQELVGSIGNSQATESMIERVRSIVTESGSLSKVEAMITQLSRQARDVIEQTEMSEISRQKLLVLMTQLTKRKS